MRKHWIDNLRWVTVLLVLLYHVIYFYNNKCEASSQWLKAIAKRRTIFGGIGGFGDGPQYQDTLMYILYPWFMPLLFLLAGISARYSLEKKTAKEWLKSRTSKLLVPATIGLLVFQWITGYFNTHVAGVDVLANIPQPAKFFMWAFSGIGPLWFIHDLWLFSVILLLIRTFDTKDNVYHSSFPLGYYIFSHDEVQEMLGKAWMALMAVAVISGVLLIVTTFGEDNTTPQYLASPLNNLYGWLMCLAMIGWFKAKFDRTGCFAGYMTRTSFGLYIVHYLVVASLGYMMKVYTRLPPVAMYAILTVAVFTLSPLLYEILRRIPVVRWCVFGERKQALNVIK